MTLMIIWALWPAFGLGGSTPDWLAWGLELLYMSLVFALCGSLIPHWVKIDGTLAASDMLWVRQTLALKKQQIPLEIAAHVRIGARVFLERDEICRAQAQLESSLNYLAACSPIEARMLWIQLLISEKKDELATKEKAAMLEDWQALGRSRAEVLDGLASLPICYGWTDMIEEALRYIEIAIQEAPDMITLKGTKSALLIDAGQVDEGLKLLEEVAASTESETDRTIGDYFRALAYLKKGDRSKARQLFREAEEKHPRSMLKPRIQRIFLNDSESSAERAGSTARRQEG